MHYIVRDVVRNKSSKCVKLKKFSADRLVLIYKHFVRNKINRCLKLKKFLTDGFIFISNNFSFPTWLFLGCIFFPSLLTMKGEICYCSQ